MRAVVLDDTRVRRWRGIAAAEVWAVVLMSVSGCASETDCVNCQANDRASGEMPASSGPDAQPPGPGEGLGPYGNCLDAPNACEEGDVPHCLLDDRTRPTMAFCSSDCDSTEQCVRAPRDGTAIPKCLSLGAERGECVLDCIAGQSCPNGMVCLPYGVCGYVTPDADNPYARCGECPDDFLGCLSTSEGSVCVPDCTQPCPSPRDGGATPSCIEANGELGCALFCDSLRPCPDGMHCTQAGFRSLCVWQEDNPCEQLECGRNAYCDVVAGVAQCECEPGTFETVEGCVDPCDELECHSTADCQVFGISPMCTCDPGQVMDADGRCDFPMTADPCDPNPCQDAASTCVEIDGSAICTCPDPTTTPPDCEEVCYATHFDGDEYEPNDCPEDATLIGAGDAGLGISRVNADLGPMMGDVDRYRLTEQAGYYWVLLESEVVLCDLDFAFLPQRAEYGGFSYGVQLRGYEQGGSFPCARQDADAGMAYSLGVLRFAAGDDLPPSVEFGATEPRPLLGPDDPTGLAMEFAVADRFAGGQDVDSFLVDVTLPLTMLYTGQSAEVSVQAFDSFGQVISQQEVECGFRLEPSACFQIDGSGPAVVSVTLLQSDNALQSELDAWWMGY